jgi:hypothetical protein
MTWGKMSEYELVRAQSALPPTLAPALGGSSRTPDERLLDTLCAQARGGAVTTNSQNDSWVFWLVLFVTILAFSRTFGFTLFEICI